LTRVHFAWLMVSAALAVILLVLLFLYTDLDLAAIGRLLRGVPLKSVGEIVLLLAFNIFLGGEKWRLIALRLQHDDGPAMPRTLYFAFTAIGVALGQIVPAQLSLVLSRSLGAHLHGGRALSRGATATLFDYFFDVLISGFLALSSLLVLLTGGGARTWVLGALAISGAGFLLYGAAARLATGVARSLASVGGGRLGRFCAAIALSPLLAPDIGRRLLAISALRFALLVLMGAVSARAIGVDLPLWQQAAALPFALIANALSITPGSLGVNEWTVSSALFALGTPFQVSAQWALVSRILVAIAAGLCGVAGLLLVAVTAGIGRSPRPPRAA
jgi:Lysylphosphatidylglycerol synthase TM region